MMFNAEYDAGSEIVGYVVPDDADSTTCIRVFGEEGLLWAGPADEPRPALVTAGRHLTGLCGFRIGTDRIPDLAQRQEIVIREASGGLTVYRRTAEPTLGRRVLRLETRLAGRPDLDAAFGRHFRAAYADIDRLGHETASQTFQLHGIASVYLSGRLHVPAYAYLIDQGFEVTAAIRDPFEELADRIVMLAAPEHAAGHRLSDRDRLIFGPVIEALEAVAVPDPAAVRRLFRRLDRRLGAILSNPLTRQLTRARPDELCSGDAASAALRTLAGLDLVVPEDGLGLVESATAIWLGVPAPGARHAAPEPASAALADMLADLPAVEAMLEFDLEVHHAVVGAAVEAVEAPPA